MVVYSILIVDLSPTFYCVPEPLLVYGSMLLLSTLILSSYSVIMVMLGYDWGLRMVINISVQYNGGFLPDIILLTQSWLEYHVVCWPILSLMEYYIALGCSLLPGITLLTQCCVLLPDSILLTQCFAIEEPVWRGLVGFSLIL